MSGARVLVTGAFGNVGANTVPELARLGHEVHALGTDSKSSRKVEVSLARQHRFTTHRVDLRDADAVRRTVESIRPEVILHIAAVIAPLAYVHPKLAYQVNVGGTHNLLAAAARLADPPRFVFTSSYIVHAPRNPHRPAPPLTGDTPVDPRDNYARHKVAGEQAVRDSGLSHAVLRLPVTLPTDLSWGMDRSFLQFFALLPPDRRQHVLDSRDAGRALANAVEAEIDGLTLTLGGPEHDCRVTAYEFHERSIRVRGLRPFPLEWFRRADPECDDAWYSEDFVDTRPSQQLLDYQQHSLADYLDYVRRAAGWSYYAMRALAPLARRRLMAESPYYGRQLPPDRRPLWTVICEHFGLDPETP
ncbi:MAG TPA: NAD-dependent epimerase/dehydratase family protein [Enhygromyxa sp.]|nr:NAD-dependent epimerase/dehydratase family protein [Enhygromyxa sp.]